MTIAAPARAVERQRAGTRAAILDAALSLAREHPDGPPSHEAVAGRAAVAARTVYRHFPTRRDLTEALWMRLRAETGPAWPTQEGEIGPALRRSFQQYEGFAALTRAAIDAGASTEYRGRGSAEGRAAFRRSLAPILAQLSESDARGVVAACVAIASAPFWQMLRDRGQLPARRAEDAAVMAIEAVIASARQRAADRRSASQLDPA